MATGEHGGGENSSSDITPSFKQKRPWKIKLFCTISGVEVPGSRFRFGTAKAVSGSTTTGTSRGSPPGDAVPSDRHFIDNGARLFEALIASCWGNTNPIRMFSAKELTEATDNYNPMRFVGKGIWRVYSGIHDGRPIAVKRAFARFFDRPRLFDMFLKEVVTLSQINHRNVVRLLGCCIETRAPILVYELVPGGCTLSRRIHSADASSGRFPWADRLRIALEVADALNYLHTSLRVPIVHGKIKSRSIFLDGSCSAKVGTFGYAELVSREELHTSRRSGSCASSESSNTHFRRHVTEKIDVYAFGLVLIELLTGKRPSKKHYVGTQSHDVHLEHFISSTQENLLASVLDTSILSEADSEQLMTCAGVAIRCIAEDVEGRPTMKELVQELRRARGRTLPA